VLGGLVSRESALEDYGVVLNGETAAIDEVATRRRREAQRPPHKLLHRFEYCESFA